MKNLFNFMFGSDRLVKVKSVQRAVSKRDRPDESFGFNFF